MIHKYAEIFCWKNVSSFCSAKAAHIFSAKNIRILYIESAKTVNEMTLNELVKLRRFEQLGPEVLFLSHMSDPDIHEWPAQKKFMWKFLVKVFRAKLSSGELHCPVTALIYKGDNFLFALRHIKPLLKKDSYRIDPFSEWKHINSA